MKRETIFSDDRVYRYTLWREWRLPHGLPYPLPLHTASDFVMFIGLNPSTADETNDDPTIRRCIGFAKAWGYGALCMTNIFALRATDPLVMKRSLYPVGGNNNQWLVDCGKEAALIVAAWGTHGDWNQRADGVRNLMKEAGLKLHCLGLTAAKHPRHPLYLKATTPTEPFQ